MYELEVIGESMRQTKKMDAAQNKIGRVGLRTNKYVAQEGNRGEIGWSTFNERITKAKGK